MLNRTQNYGLKPPLIRISVENSGFEDLRTFYLNSLLAERSANRDVIVTHSKSKKSQEQVIQSTNSTIRDLMSILQEEVELIQEGFSIVSPQQFVDAVDNVVQKSDNRALETLFECKKQMAINLLRSKIHSEYDEYLMNANFGDLDIANLEPTFKRKGSPKTSGKKARIMVKTNT